MYAVIATGGKQERVEVGSVIDVELLGAGEGEDVSLRPVLVVDGETVLAAPGELAAASVSGRVIGFSKGPKITGFTYRPKARGRRRFGHRQHYSTIEIIAIDTAGSSAQPTGRRGTRSRTAAAEA